MQHGELQACLVFALLRIVSTESKWFNVTAGSTLLQHATLTAVCCRIYLELVPLRADLWPEHGRSLSWCWGWRHRKFQCLHVLFMIHLYRGACARRKTVILIGLKYTQFLLSVTINHNKDCHKNEMCVNSFIWKSIVRCLTKTWLISTMQIWRTYLLNRISVKYQWCVKSQDGQFIFCIFSVMIGILQNKICMHFKGLFSVTICLH